MIDILRNNNFTTPNIHNDSMWKNNKRAKQKERRILKGFNLTTSDVIKEAFATNASSEPKDFFAVIAKAIGKKSPAFGKKEGADVVTDPSKFEFKKFDHKKKLGSFKRKLSKNIEEDLTQTELLQYNPNLAKFTPTTRLAYAKFKTRLESKKAMKLQGTKEKPEGETEGQSDNGKQKGGVSGSSTCFTIVDDEFKVEDTNNVAENDNIANDIVIKLDSDVSTAKGDRMSPGDVNDDPRKNSSTAISKSNKECKEETTNDHRNDLKCLIPQNDVPYSLCGSVLDSQTDLMHNSCPEDKKTGQFSITNDEHSTVLHINTIMSPLHSANKEPTSSPLDKRYKAGKSPSPPLVPPRGVVRTSSSTSSQIWALPGASNTNKNRPLSQDSKDSIPYADTNTSSSDEGRYLKDCIVINVTNGRETEILREKDSMRNMIVHNRSRENYSSIENVSVESNGTNSGRPVATIVPHNCLGGCEPVNKGQMKTGWL